MKIAIEKTLKNENYIFVEHWQITGLKLTCIRTSPIGIVSTVTPVANKIKHLKQHSPSIKNQK